MSYVPLRRSNRLHATMYEKYVEANKKYMQEIKKIMGGEFGRANLKKKIQILTKIMRILIEGFNSMLLYGIYDVREEPQGEAIKMFKNVYFRTFVWMKEADDEKEEQKILGKQIEKYRKMYKAYRLSNIGVVSDAFGLNDDLVDMIDAYI